MRNKLIPILLLTIGSILLTSTHSYAKSSVWKVSKGENLLYLAGTIHMLSSDDYPLPDQFERAYQQSNSVVFEVDTRPLLAEPKLHREFQQLIRYPNGHSLKSHITPATFKALRLFLSDRGLSIEPMLSLTPAGVSINLSMLEIQRLGLAKFGHGVEDFFTRRATEDNKPILSLESLSQHYQFVEKMNQLDPDHLVMSTLTDLENTTATWHDMLFNWRLGKMQELERIALTPMQQQFPKLKKTLIDERNNDWVNKIATMLNDKSIELVMVGSLHLVGENGLLNLLSSTGFTVEQLN